MSNILIILILYPVRRIIRCSGVFSYKTRGYDDILKKNNKITSWIITHMDRLIIKLSKITILLSSLIYTCALSVPITASEEINYVGADYYGNDINAAVLEANENNRSLNYNRQYWYNRTTSKSFELDPLGSHDLEKARLEGALGSTAAGLTNGNIAAKVLFAEDQINLIQKGFQLNQDNTTLAARNNMPIKRELNQVNIKYNSSVRNCAQEGEIKSCDITSTGTVTSTPRP